MSRHVFARSVSGVPHRLGAILLCAAVPVASAAPVIEFYNGNLDNYFITANAVEAAAVDSGAAGPGWTRTGDTFNEGRMALA